jgi:hypothetical protein
VHPGGIQTSLQRHLTGIVGLLARLLLALLSWLPFVARIKSIPQVGLQKHDRVEPSHQWPCFLDRLFHFGSQIRGAAHATDVLQLCQPAAVAVWDLEAAGTLPRRGVVASALRRNIVGMRMQGVSTTIYAATAPELGGRGGSYLADCAVAEPSLTCRDMDQVGQCRHADMGTDE